MIGHIAPEAALGGPIALVEEGDTIVIDVDRKALDLEVPADEIAERLRALDAAPRPTTPAACMAKYAALVGSASEGAVTTGPRMTANLPAAALTPVTDAASRSGSRPRPRPSTGRRSMRAGRGSASTTVFESVWMNDHLTDISLDRARAEPRGR